jgi:hypothetical protein
MSFHEYARVDPEPGVVDAGPCVLVIGVVGNRLMR